MNEQQAKMRAHEYADMFPRLNESDLNELAADIKSHGQNDPITVLDGAILDGRNRYAACQIAGVEPITHEYEGNDPLSFVLSQNLHRRHLSVTQRAMMAEKVATMRAGGDRGNQFTGGKSSSDDLPQPDRKTRAQAAKDLDVSEPSIDRARYIRKHGVPELVESVEMGNITVAAGQRIAKLDPSKQSEAIKKPSLAPKPKPRPMRTPEQKTNESVSSSAPISVKLFELSNEASTILRNISIPSKDADIAKLENIINKIKEL